MCLTLDLEVMNSSSMLSIEITLKKFLMKKKSKYVLIESFTHELSVYEVWTFGISLFTWDFFFFKVLTVLQTLEFARYMIPR